MFTTLFMTSSNNSLAETTWIPIIAAILSSSVIVGVFQFIQWNKDRKIKNITSERKEWRAALRKIAAKLYTAKNQTDLDIILTKLKVRINPKGMIINLTQDSDSIERREGFKKDCYIWMIIRELEKPTDSFCQKKELIQGLIESISILVKYDWDRSKEEINNSTKHFYTCFTVLFIFIIIFAFLSDSYLNYLILMGLFVLVPFIFQYNRFKFSERIDLNKKPRKIRDKFELNNQVSTVIICCFLLSIFVLIVMGIFHQKYFNILLVNLLVIIIFATLSYFMLEDFFRARRFYTNDYYITLIYNILIKLNIIPPKND